MTDSAPKLIEPNIVFSVAPFDPERPQGPRALAPAIWCEQCKEYVTNGGKARVYASELDDPATMPEEHRTIPIVVHDDCLAAFLDKHPGRWSPLCTVTEFVERLYMFVRLDAPDGPGPSAGAPDGTGPNPFLPPPGGKGTPDFSA